jgi:hypothetical protein
MLEAEIMKLKQIIEENVTEFTRARKKWKHRIIIIIQLKMKVSLFNII